MDRPKFDNPAPVTLPSCLDKLGNRSVVELVETTTISSLTASRDLVTVQRTIEQRYGFVPSLAYCNDLIAFVEALTDGQ